MTVAFFDLDRTLIDVNSGLLYAQYEKEVGRISASQLLRAMGWLLGYHFGAIDMDKAYAQALAHYRGWSAEELDAITKVWFKARVEHRLLPEARERMEWHRTQGHTLCILSNTSQFQADIAAKTWGFEHWLANYFVTDDAGCLTGELVPPMCYKEGKVTHAQRLLDELGETMEECYFYSDSISDLPMLAASGNPVVINPDPRLAREAEKRAWKVEHWELPFDDAV